jgi:hypothetical protein
VTPAGTELTNIVRPGLARTADGALHVSWTREDGGTAESLLHSSISADAKTVSGPDGIFSSADGINPSSVLLASGNTLRVLLGATNQFSDALGTATSSDGGKTWTSAAPASRAGNDAKPVYAASGLAGALGPTGNVFTAWGASAPSGSGFHIGLDPSDPDGGFNSGTVIDPGVGVDSQSGAAYAAANLLDDDGVAVFPISPGGGRIVIPNSGANQLQHPTHITGRLGAPGVFVAYTKGSSEFLGRAAIWDIENGRGRVLGKKGDEDVSIAAAPDGRLWVFWRGDDDVRATRSNPSLTQWGRVVRVRNPKGTEVASDLTGSGSAGPLDVVLQAEVGEGVASWHQRILPGLTVKATRLRDKVIFKVTDAGQPVPGANVKVKKQGSKKTGQKGTVKFALDEGRYSAKASKKGYSASSIRVRVK